jgi:hypothetical protein
MKVDGPLSLQVALPLHQFYLTKRRGKVKLGTGFLHFMHLQLMNEAMKVEGPLSLQEALPLHPFYLTKCRGKVKLGTGFLHFMHPQLAFRQLSLSLSISDECVYI